MTFIREHKMIVSVVALLVALFAWYGFSGSKGEAPLLAAQGPAAVSTAAERNLVETLIALRAITLSGTIFSDPAFLSLQDFGTQIVPEPMGRRDPFAPLSSERGADGEEGGTKDRPGSARP